MADELSEIDFGIIQNQKKKLLQSLGAKEPLPTNVSGVAFPDNIQSVEFGKALAKNQAQQVQDEYNAKVASNVGASLGVIKNLISKGATLPQIAEALKVNQSYLESPQFSAELLKQFVIPLTEDYDRDYPGTKGFENILTRLEQGVLPEAFLKPSLQTLRQTLDGYKPIIAKGLLGQAGNLTAEEQKDPLKLFPSAEDLPETRSAKLIRLKKLLGMFGANGIEQFSEEKPIQINAPISR